MSPDSQDQNPLCAAAFKVEETGELGGAASLFRQAIRCDTRNAAPYPYFGNVLMSLGKSDAAIQVWSLGADLDARFINAWLSEGIDTLIRGRSKLAHDAIRVADTVHEWPEGKVFAFDDAFSHESWNKGPKFRVNLLFEAWHPDSYERRAKCRYGGIPCTRLMERVTHAGTLSSRDESSFRGDELCNVAVGDVYN